MSRMRPFNLGAPQSANHPENPGLSRIPGKKLAGAAGLEPVTSAVTGQRSNQLSYAPAMGDETIENVGADVKVWLGKFLSVFLPIDLQNETGNILFTDGLAASSHV